MTLVITTLLQLYPSGDTVDNDIDNSCDRNYEGDGEREVIYQGTATVVSASKKSLMDSTSDEEPSPPKPAATVIVGRHANTNSSNLESESSIGSEEGEYEAFGTVVTTSN
jgi:hypothetical protein